MRRNCRAPCSVFLAASKACCSMAPTRRCWSARSDRTPRSGSLSHKRDVSPTSRSARWSPSVLTPDASCVFEPAAMAAESIVGLPAPRARLALLLLLAPALVWLVGLIVLPHLELAVLSLRARVAPHVYEV